MTINYLYFNIYILYAQYKSHRIIQNNLYINSINIVKPHELWDFIKITTTAPVFVYSGAFIWSKGTHVIFSHLILDDT